MSGVNFNATTPQQMYQMYGAGQTGYVPYTGASTTPMKMQGQLDKDVYQPSGPGLTEIGATAVAGGALGASAGYWWLNNPITKGENGALEVNPKIYKSYDHVTLQNAIEEEVKASKLNLLQQNNVQSLEQFNALKELSKAESFEALPAETKAKLTGLNITDPAVAKTKVEALETAFINNIDRETIVKNTSERLKNQLVGGKFEFLQNYDSVKAALDKLGANATQEQLEQFILDNKKMFNLAGMSDAEVAQEVEILKGKKQAGILSELKTTKDNYERTVNGVKSKILEAFDKEGKLKPNIDKEMKSILGDFKVSQAKKLGKWGAIIGGGLTALYSMFA